MGSSDLATTAWRKSSYTVGEGDETNCVEVAGLPGRIAMRDSKDPAGPVLAFTRGQWRAFLDSIHTAQFH